MGYSSKEAKAIRDRYHDAFGLLPEGLARWVANTGQGDQMLQIMERALQSGTPPNWSDSGLRLGRPRKAEAQAG